jgi:hypothetical protein
VIGANVSETGTYLGDSNLPVPSSGEKQIIGCWLSFAGTHEPLDQTPSPSGEVLGLGLQRSQPVDPGIERCRQIRGVVVTASDGAPNLQL